MNGKIGSVIWILILQLSVCTETELYFGIDEMKSVLVHSVNASANY